MLLEVSKEIFVLVLVEADLNDLGDILISLEVKGSHSHLVKLAEIITSQRLNLLRPGRGPHQYLAIRTNLGANFTKLRLETHVKLGTIRGELEPHHKQRRHRGLHETLTIRSASSITR
jgi:hypothetical protein